MSRRLYVSQKVSIKVTSANDQRSHDANGRLKIMKLPLHCGSQNIKYKTKLIITVREHKREHKPKYSCT